MDKTLELKLADFKEALGRLSEALAEEKNEFIRDSIIKRFEFAFEIGWKTAKVYLENKFGIDAHSPKEVFRQLRANNVIKDNETETFLVMTDDRNQIVHTYDLDFSEEVSRKIESEYYGCLRKIFEIIKE